MNNEIWRDIKDYEGLYQVSNLGRIRGLKRWDINLRSFVNKVKILKPMNNGKDYLFVVLKKNKKGTRHYVQRLVAEAFLEDFDGKKVITHKDLNRKNNCIENIECISKKELYYIY